ncbi:hypothetical protein Ahy_B03g067253 [Arachis hypogaea]|uniref:PB1-like domain-containing protein n=1 Tax=Arachis hypogaea TaxID=3818 RepID=A0A445A6C2_ARAHY|nr:hypothetical protein Ahy_B03g067253 [Arachis hypogaea]
MKAYTFVLVTEWFRSTKMSYFSVKVYHQGSFELQGGPLKYLGGETTVIDYCNEDEWGLIEVYDIVSRQGYLKKDIAAMWYKSQDQNTEEGLRMLRTDKDAMDMANIGVREDMVELYVVHKTSDIHEEVEDVHMLGSEDKFWPNVEEEIVGKKDGSDEPDEEEEGSDGSEDENYEPKGGEDDSCDSWSSDSINGDSSEDSATEVVFGDSDDDKEGAEGLVDVNIRANKVAGSTRRASRIISSTISSTVSSTISSQASKQSQAASKKTTTSRPKRKFSVNDGAAKPSKHVSISQLKFMARTPLKAWKKM